MSDLASRDCVPCRGGVEPLHGEELETLHRELGNDWKVVDEHHLTKKYTFPDFASALSFTNELGELAEDVGHHPEITLGWGKVEVELYTHKIDGLAEADFVWAARADELPRG